MLLASLKGLLSYRGRLFATVLAIALGVGFVAGTMLFVDSIEASFTDTLAAQERGVDVAVVSDGDLDDTTGALSSYAGMPVAVAAQVAQVEGVAAAEGRLTGVVQLLDAGGKQLGSAGGRVVATSVASTEQLRWVQATEGRAPAAAGEIAVDASLVESAGLTVGQELQVAVGDQVRPVTLVGVVDPGLALLSTGIGVVAIPRSDLEAMAGEGAFYDRVDVIAAEGVAPDQLAASITAALGTQRAQGQLADYVGVTGEELVRQAQENLSGELLAVRAALGSFAAIALFVAAYVITNTFTILVTQRAGQLAILRCLGARRGQVFRATVAEALLLGVAGSVLGLVLGLGLVFVLRSFFTLFGLSIGTVSLTLTPPIILTSVAVGMVVTMTGSVLPALRATRVPPLAAMRAQALSVTSRPNVVITVLGVLSLLGGAAGLAGGISTGEVFLGLAGAMFVFLGTNALSPFIVGPLARLLGLVSGATRPVSGKLATENAVRNPKRTAATTGALVIGVTLMTVFVVAGESARVSALGQLEEEFPVDYTIGLDQGALPAELTQGLTDTPEFADWVEARQGGLQVNGEFVLAAGVGLERLAGPIGDAIDLGIVDGSVEELPGFNIGFSAEQAAELGVGYGDAVRISNFQQEFEARVSLIYTNEVFGASMLSMDSLQGLSGGQATSATAFVKAAEGVDAATSRAAVDTLLVGFPDAEVRDRANFIEEITTVVNNLLGLVGGLLGLAIIIALLGIANTLGLSVIERVRESAVLRSLGLTRTQLRGMLAVEAVITALIGSLMGLGLGLLFAYTALSAVGDEITFSVPWLQVALGLAGAIVVGLLASVLPGRAAARTNVVGAMTAQ